MVATCMATERDPGMSTREIRELAYRRDPRLIDAHRRNIGEALEHNKVLIGRAIADGMASALTGVSDLVSASSVANDLAGALARDIADARERTLDDDLDLARALDLAERLQAEPELESRRDLVRALAEVLHANHTQLGRLWDRVATALYVQVHGPYNWDDRDRPVARDPVGAVVETLYGHIERHISDNEALRADIEDLHRWIDQLNLTIHRQGLTIDQLDADLRRSIHELRAARQRINELEHLAGGLRAQHQQPGWDRDRLGYATGWTRRAASGLDWQSIRDQVIAGLTVLGIATAMGGQVSEPRVERDTVITIINTTINLCDRVDAVVDEQLPASE